MQKSKFQITRKISEDTEYIDRLPRSVWKGQPFWWKIKNDLEKGSKINDTEKAL